MLSCENYKLNTKELRCSIESSSMYRILECVQLPMEGIPNVISVSVSHALRYEGSADLLLVYQNGSQVYSKASA